jgi:phospholipase C
VTKPLTDRIEHIVVLMFENRSFDNVFGGLYPERTRAGSFRGLTGAETNPLDPENPSAGSVQVFQGPFDAATCTMPYPDPGESYEDMVEQLFGSTTNLLPTGIPPMTGFAGNYRKQPAAKDMSGTTLPPEPVNIMQYYSAATMPVSWYLARQFAVCDTWFASGPVQTYANRVFAHCGTPGRVPGTNLARINNPDFIHGIAYGELIAHVLLSPPVTDLTVFEALDIAFPQAKAAGPGRAEEAGTALNWKIYYHDVPVSALCKYVWDHWHPLNIGGNLQHFEDVLPGSLTHFEKDVRDGTLPKYSFIEPRYTDIFGGTVNNNHPGGAGVDPVDPNAPSPPPAIDVRDGEILLNTIYGILYRYPETFKKTLFVVTYDEHGGLYDHCPPPPAASPFDPPVDNFPYNRYGVRVPTLFINPYIQPSSIYPPRAAFAPVASPPHDHTSLIKTVLQQFDIGLDFGPRVDSAPPIAGILTDDYHLPPPCPNPKHAPMARPPRARVQTLGEHVSTLGGALAPLYQYIQDWKDKAGQP